MSTTAWALDEEGWPIGIPRPPSVDELPIDDGEPVESEYHGKQAALLATPLERHFAGDPTIYVAANMGVFYSAIQARHPPHRAPDAFVVTETDRRVRKAWVAWEEDGRLPDVVVEVCSPSTVNVDRVEKYAIYERLGIRYYFLYDPVADELLGYRLGDDGKYRPIEPLANGLVPCELLALSVGRWAGTHRGVTGTWVRWYTPDATLVATEAEAASGEAAAARAAAAAASAAAETAKAEVEAAKTEAARLAARLAAYEARFGKLDSE